MGRFVHPGSVRYGNMLDWAGESESPAGFLKIKPFLDYMERVLKDKIYLEEGVVISSVKIVAKKEVYILEIELYDRFLELLLRDGGTSAEQTVESTLGEKLLVIKRLLLSEGIKYFGKAVEVQFKVISMQNISASGLSKFVAYNLERGYSLVSILRIISKEFKGVGDQSSRNKQIKLSHRYQGAYSDGVRLFNKVAISGRYLLGYRIDIAGRYSRKQRADKRSISEGTVPLGVFKGCIDYGMSRAIMLYGASSVRVWLYYDRVKKEEGEFLCKIR